MRPFMLFVALAAAFSASSGSAAAQDRMPPIPADKLTEAQKKAIEEFKAARSVDISGPFVAMLRSPEVMTRARAMGDYLRFRSSLPPRLNEFAILIVARKWNAQYNGSRTTASPWPEGSIPRSRKTCGRAGFPRT